MLNANSSGDGDGYPGDWMRTCNTCKAAVSTLYCHTHLAYFCDSCDERVRAYNSMALPHERVWVSAACENGQAAFSCNTDAASLRLSCDADKHLANFLAHHHHARVPAPPFSDLFTAPSSTYLPDPMFDTEKEVTAPTIDEVDEDEMDSWLLLEPANHDNQMNSGHTYVQELDESFGMEYNSCTKHECQDQNNLQQLQCTHRGDNGSDGVVPVQPFQVKDKEEQQKQQQQQENEYFSRKYEASKAAFINNPSISQTVRFLIFT